MTPIGLIHILSLIYLAAIISFVLSLNENRRPRRIRQETLRRWGKFLGFTLLIAVVVHFLS